MYCSREQPKKETGDSSAAQTSPSTIYATIDRPQPEIVYGNIQPNTEPVAENGDLYANQPSKNTGEDSEPEPVIYSELLRKDGDVRI